MMTNNQVLVFKAIAEYLKDDLEELSFSISEIAKAVQFNVSDAIQVILEDGNLIIDIENDGEGEARYYLLEEGVKLAREVLSK